MEFLIASFLVSDKINWTLAAVAAVAVLLLVLYICIHFSKGKRKGRAAEKK